MLFQTDEIGGMLQSINKAKDDILPVDIPTEEPAAPRERETGILSPDASYSPLMTETTWAAAFWTHSLPSDPAF